jgi:signal transduction histidine kinase
METKVLIVGKSKSSAGLMRKVKKTLGRKCDVRYFVFGQTRKFSEEIANNDVFVICEDAYLAAKQVYASNVNKPIIFLAINRTFDQLRQRLTKLTSIGGRWKLISLEDANCSKVLATEIRRYVTGQKFISNLQQFRTQLKFTPIERENHIPYYRQLLKVEQNIQKKNKELVKANIALQNLDKLKSSFINTTSHELKTPLVSIILGAELLLGENIGRINKKQRDSLVRVLHSAKHLNILLNDILDSAKLESENLKLARRKHDLKSLITQTKNDISAFSMKKKINVRIRVKELPKVYMDYNRVTQVLLNLLSNSIKFTPENGSILIDAVAQKDNILVSVSDSGIGIDKKMQAKIFDKFVQATPSYKLKEKGTGLGLSICKQIIELHGGKIWAESAGKNKGSTFYFTLPISKGKA